MMSANTILGFAGTIAGTIATTWVAFEKFYKDKKDTQLAMINMSAGHLNTLSDSLIHERAQREEEIAKLQEKVSELYKLMEALRTSLNNKEMTIRELTTTGVEKDKQIVYLQSELLQRDGRINQLQGEVRQIKQIDASTVSNELRALRNAEST